MTFEAKTMVPLPCDPEAAHAAFQDAACGRLTFLEVPPGYTLTEGLALAFSDLDRRPLWLRLGPEDGDPATFLLSLVTAARRLQPDAGQETLDQMKEQPGPVFGWGPLFTRLAGDLRTCLAPQGALVLEDLHATADSPTLALVGRHLLPGLGDAAPCVLMSQHKPQAATLGGCRRRSASELRLSAASVSQTLDKWAPELTARARDRAMWLVGGRAALLAGVRELADAAGRGLGPLLERVASRDELVSRTAEILLTDTDLQARCALGLAARIEYAHPAMTSAMGGGDQLPSGPWLQHLEEGWVRVRPCWRKALRAVLGDRAAPGHDALHQAAEWLLDTGAFEQAVVLYLEIGDYDCATRAIVDHASVLMDLGQWATVDHWLGQIPDELFNVYPELICSRAEIAAVGGDTTTARRWFDRAASHYARRNDLKGQCHSMLAASAAAAEAGDLVGALSRAHAASSAASTEELSAVRMWATWQAGRVSLAAGDHESALSAFRHAASSAGTDGAMVEAHLVRMTGDLASRVAELRQGQESHREAQAVLSHAEHEALNQLMAAIRTPELRRGKLLGPHGWSGTPPPLKLPGLIGSDELTPGIRGRPLGWLRRALLQHREGQQRGRPPHPVPIPGLAAAGAGPETPPPQADRGDPGDLAATVRVRRASPRVSDPAGQPELAVHLLGPLYAAIDDMAVEDWPSARCRSLFGYLLMHREPWPAREVLMEVFWPGSSPDASRNSLNVAIHGLRRTLRTITDRPLIRHAGGSYGIDRGLRLWLDVDAFDRCVESGRRAEDAKDIDAAMRDYEFAEGLYRGDFMIEDPYEDWTALTREHLRLAHVDALGRLSNLYFDAGHYTACASLCQRIIAKDPCREDAHRRLMRCYSRQGQQHLALMQYRTCARTLASELGVDTDPATRELHEHIRRREYV